jgi:hypothetical protein
MSMRQKANKYRMPHLWPTLLLALLFTAVPATSGASTGNGSSAADLSGTVEDPSGAAVANADVTLVALDRQATLAATTDLHGRFEFRDLLPGSYRLTAEASGFSVTSTEITVFAAQSNHVALQFVQLSTQNQSVVVVASEPAALTPDPSQRLLVHDEVLDGLRWHQVAPGVAGDHGEPIAQYFEIGDFLFPNNLPANAHGNGYSDPNPLISQGIGAVQVDGGAFNVRQGNHAVNLAAAYVPRDRLEPFLQLTGDYRDIDLVGGWSPSNPAFHGWVGLEAAYGNGYLDRLEHRKQVKFNTYRSFRAGRHAITIFGIAYYGFSDVPGLIPRDAPVPDDTIDPRQNDQTHTAIFVTTDTWQFAENQQLQWAAFLRTYNLQLRSNFGDGLIQQGEFRTVAGGNATYLQKFNRAIVLLAGFDLRRDAPRDLDLKHADEKGVFQPVTSNDLTLGFATPYVSLDGGLTRYLHYDIGVRQEEVLFNNVDKIVATNSFDTQQGLTLTKGTLTILPPIDILLPQVSFSFGEGFHTNDPRIGSAGTSRGTILVPSHALQLVLQKNMYQTDVRVTLARVTDAQEFAKIDPDTGLQQDVGPSIVKSITISARRYGTFGYLQGSFARADAHDRIIGRAIPEAPRLIWDASGGINRLPFGFKARGEFEYVGRKFLGEDAHGNVLTAIPVTEIRGALLRSFQEGRMDAGVSFLLAHGFTGQTVETLQLAGEPMALPRVVGVLLKSYVSLAFTYHFVRAHGSSP